MTAETGNDAESTKKRGRIPQSAWPSIVERYRTGATLSAIAREYECTPSAISYIIRKAEAAGIEGETFSADDEAQSPDASSSAAAEQPQPVETSKPVGAAKPVETPKPVEVAKPAEAPPAPPPVAPPVQQTLRLNPQPRDPEPALAPPPTAPVPPPVPVQTAASANVAPGARPEPTPPLDGVEARLRETARGCLSAYRSWRQTPGETSIQALSDAVHELRKALARVEIDMSASRRDEQAIRPIPIPAHRAARRPQ